MRDTTGGWTLEDEAAAGAIGGHAGTHDVEGIASGDTLGGTIDGVQVRHEDLEPLPEADRAPEPEER